MSLSESVNDIIHPDYFLISKPTLVFRRSGAHGWCPFAPILSAADASIQSQLSRLQRR